MIMQNFKIIKRISDGAFGTVYEANVVKREKYKDLPELIAIKQMFSSSQNIKREISLLKKLPKSSHIIEVYDSFTENFTTSIIMERGSYDLTYWIELMYYPIPEKIVKNIVFQILKGVSEVHSSGIVHRDLKPSNLIVKQDGTIAICDFGSAVECTKGDEYEIEGFTRWYKAPQMLFGDRRYGYEVDIWSIGCIIAEIATGEPLLSGKSQIEQLSMISVLLGDPSVDNWASVVKMPDFGKIIFKKAQPKKLEEISEEYNFSKELAGFLMKMLRYEKRFTAEQLLKDDYLKDLENVNIGKDLEKDLFKMKKQLLSKAKKLKNQ